MKTQLLCTFSKKEVLDDTINLIVKHYDIVFNKLYVLNDEGDNKMAIITYNVNYENNLDYNSVSNTISIHRKKQTNTLYTINALNEVIRSKNGGVLDKSFQVDWSEFQNSLLLTNDSGLNIIKTKIHKIININDWEIDY